MYQFFVYCTRPCAFRNFVNVRRRTCFQFGVCLGHDSELHCVSMYLFKNCTFIYVKQFNVHTHKQINRYINIFYYSFISILSHFYVNFSIFSICKHIYTYKQAKHTHNSFSCQIWHILSIVMVGQVGKV